MRLTAKESYKLQLNKVQSMMEELQLRLKDHQKLQESNSRNWGHVGDMEHINETLESLLNSFLSKSGIETYTAYNSQGKKNQSYHS